MTTLRVSLPDLYDDGFRKVFHDGFNKRLGELQTVFGEPEGSSKNNESTSRVGTLGLFPQIEEGEPLTYDDPPQGFDVTFTHQEFAMGWQVGQVAREDDQYDVLSKIPRQLGISLKVTKESDGQNDLNFGFGTAGDFSGGDGVALFSASHPLPGGGTESNLASTPADLDEDSYEQARIDIYEWVDDRGKKVSMIPQKVIGTIHSDWAAKKLFMSPNEPGTANNAINPGFKSGVSWHVLSYLTDNDAWFIQCDQHFMKWYDRVKESHGHDQDFPTNNWRYKARARWSHGWDDWYGMWGNAGGGA